MHSSSPHLALGSNSIWLTLPSTPENLLIQTYLLGLGADHSLLCALPENQGLDCLEAGLPCKGRSCIDGEIYEFETAIQEVLAHPPTIRLEAPQNISRQTARAFPRLPVKLTGTVRPLSEKGHILAVLPIRLSNLSPTGCQLSGPSSAWPLVSSTQLHINCRLPDFHYHSKFSGRIEWVQPTKELIIGVKFLFSSTQDPARQDIIRWYTSQQAYLVDTTA
jgi:hypothetical protein